MKIETQCLHEGYTPQNGQPLTLPIYQSTTYKYESTAQVAKLFDLTADGHMYSRISNPTVAAVEEKIAALEGGVGALCTTSGQAATLIAVLNILSAGDHILCSSTIYGGTINLLAVTLKRFGIETSFVDADADEETLKAQIQPNTKAVFAETIANPAIAVLDIEKMARVAHSHNIPLIVDNTFATPILCRPFEFGADIVIHSTTKYMDGHATQVGGVIVDSGKFDWTNGNFPEFNFQEFPHDAPVDSIADAVVAMPFMAERKCVTVSDLNVEAMNTAELDKLYELLDTIPETTVLILYLPTLEIDPKKSAKWRTFLKKLDTRGFSLPSLRLKDNELEKYVCREAEKANCLLSRKLAERIVQYVGNDLNALTNEVTKLCAFAGGGEITAEQVEKTVTKNMETTVFLLSNALVRGDYSKAYALLDLLMASAKNRTRFWPF